MKKRFLVAPLCAAVILSLLAGCGDSYRSSAAVESAPAYEEAGMYDSSDVYAGAYAGEAADYDYEEAYDSASGDAVNKDPNAERVEESGATSSRKLIRNVDMDIETEQFDELLSNLEKKVKELGGYIESSGIYSNSYTYSDNESRSASMTARIPADKLDAFLGAVSAQSNVTRKNENVDDITLTYVDLESHRNALQEEEKRLLSFMEDAETVEDLITIEDRLTDVRYQLESMESQLRTYDNQVNYSTVNMNIAEVEKYTPPAEETTGDRILRGLTERLEAIAEGFKEFGIGFVIHIPDFIVVAVIIIVILIIVALIVRGRKKHRERKEHGGDPKEGGSSD